MLFSHFCYNERFLMPYIFQNIIRNYKFDSINKKGDKLSIKNYKQFVVLLAPARFFKILFHRNIFIASSSLSTVTYR